MHTSVKFIRAWWFARGVVSILVSKWNKWQNTSVILNVYVVERVFDHMCCIVRMRSNNVYFQLSLILCFLALCLIALSLNVSSLFGCCFGFFLIFFPPVVYLVWKLWVKYAWKLSKVLLYDFWFCSFCLLKCCFIYL